jgi:hypothetical protein
MRIFSIPLRSVAKSSGFARPALTGSVLNSEIIDLPTIPVAIVFLAIVGLLNAACMTY